MVYKTFPESKCLVIIIGFENSKSNSLQSLSIQIKKASECNVSKAF
jgi:hypothetical protein